MFAARLKQAREAAGFTMKELSEEVGVSANAIKKYEHGENMPSSGNLLKLARALGVRSEYFFRPLKVALENVEYRKHASTPKKLLNQINGDVMDQAERWIELLNLYPDSVKPVPTFKLPGNLPDSIDTLEGIEAIAKTMRNEWELGQNPIPDMIDTLESKGIMIISTDKAGDDPVNLTKKRFDGLAGMVNGIPLIVISAYQPGDRQRFTLAHELGHLVLKGRLNGIDEEQACNHFAGAFLLPQQAVIQHIGAKRRSIEARELYLLKHEFGISMMAILYRLGQCGIINDSLQKTYYMQFNKKQWRTIEPGEPYPKEETVLYKQLVYRALAEEYISESKAAELLGVSLSKFHQERMLGEVRATVN